MKMDNRALAVFALTNNLIENDSPPLKASEFWPLFRSFPNVEDLLGLSENKIRELTPDSSIDARRLAQLLDTGITQANQLTSLEDLGIAAITASSDRYPQRIVNRLGLSAPPILYVAGDPNLLKTDGIGVVGSRKVSESGFELAQETAKLTVREGKVLVSGGARGVDQISMTAAIEAQGYVVGILADSLETSLRQANNRQPVLEGQACLCTPYNPRSGFTVGKAMGRNKIIYGLAHTTLVIQTEEGSGGTWAGATEALKRNYGSVGVWMGHGASSGNKALKQLGAQGIEDLNQLLMIPPVATFISEPMTLRFEN